MASLGPTNPRRSLRKNRRNRRPNVRRSPPPPRETAADGGPRKTFVLQHPPDCSPFGLISRQGDSEIAISDIKSSQSRRKCKRQPCPWWRGGPVSRAAGAAMSPAGLAAGGLGSGFVQHRSESSVSAEESGRIPSIDRQEADFAEMARLLLNNDPRKHQNPLTNAAEKPRISAEKGITSRIVWCFRGSLIVKSLDRHQLRAQDTLTTPFANTLGWGRGRNRRQSPR